MLVEFDDCLIKFIRNVTFADLEKSSMNTKKIITILTLIALTSIAAGALTVQARGQKNPRPQPVVYVESQGLYYDSIVTADPLPWEGPFQELYMTADHGLTTMYGPGDQGYVGGRWWMDTNENGSMDSDDHYFSCPLLGPGYITE